jgi:hypothetical protein
MPSIVVSSPQFTQSGIALTASSCVEQVNGLVQVQATYTIAASRQSQLDALFYVDAPPPIHPSCISKANLLTNRLYMVQRSVSTSNGFCTVNAEYVGGLVRQGFVGYYLTEQLDGTRFKTAWILPTGTNYIDFNGTFTTTAGPVKFYILRYESYQVSVEFVRIGQASAVLLPNISGMDLLRNFRITENPGSGEVATSMPIVFGMPFSDYTIKITPIIVEESRNYSTPSVQVVTIKHRTD